MLLYTINIQIPIFRTIAYLDLSICDIKGNGPGVILRDHSFCHKGYKQFAKSYRTISSFLATVPLSVNIWMVYTPEEKPFSCIVCLSLLSAVALYTT